MREEERLKLENKLLLTKSKAQMINMYLDTLSIIKEVRKYIETYEAIIGYYDSTYDGEYDTYSHDFVKEDVLKILNKENKYE